MMWRMIVLEPGESRLYNQAASIHQERDTRTLEQ